MKIVLGVVVLDQRVFGFGVLANLLGVVVSGLRV